MNNNKSAATPATTTAISETTTATLTGNSLVARIVCGNYYDSRIGSHSYAMWTVGEDYEILTTSGQMYGYTRRNYDCDRVSSIAAPVTFEGTTEEVTWDKVPTSIKRALFRTLFQHGTEEEMNIFVFGQEVGAEKNRINRWAADHQVYSREITMSLREELGEFTEVKGGRSWSRMRGTSCRNHEYIIDDKWRVIVYANCVGGGEIYDSYSVEEYAPVLVARKAFGRRVARLAKAVEMPWDIAVFAGNIENDQEAIEVLKAVKAARGTADEALSWELSCGIGRRVAALRELLGDNWEKLSCGGQGQTTRLANYLLGD